MNDFGLSEALSVVALFSIIIVFVYIRYFKNNNNEKAEEKNNDPEETLSGLEMSFIDEIKLLKDNSMDPVNAEKIVNKILNYARKTNNTWEKINSSEQELKELLRLARVNFYKKVITGFREGDLNYTPDNFPNFLESIKLFIEVKTTSWEELGTNEEEIKQLVEKQEVVNEN